MVDLIITILFSVVSGNEVRIGTFRPLRAVPLKAAELAVVGLAVGMVASVSCRRLDVVLITLSLAFVLLLDVDHIPSFFGYAQPIRPAHSFTYLATIVVALFFAVRNRPEVELIAIASFLGHLSADSGIFAPFAPFSFSYMSLDGYKIPLVIGSVSFALAAGYVKRRNSSPLRLHVQSSAKIPPTS